MVVPDANVILYAHNEADIRHERAKSWWQNALNGDEFVGLSWQVILAFVRISTNRRIVASPFTIGESLDIVREWLDRDRVLLLQPGFGHLTIFSDLLAQAGVGGELVADAHLAALAIENGATLVSHDRDFQRFSGLKLYDPIKIG